MALYRVKKESGEFILEPYSGLHAEILTGEALRAFVADVPQYRGELYESAKRYVYGESEPEIWGVFGPEGTGKRTVMRQVIADMSEEDFARTAYMIPRAGQNMYDISWEFESLERDGFKYVFIEDVTSVGLFDTHADLLPDFYAWIGMRIVVTGCNQVIAWLTSCDTLYCRIRRRSSAHVSYKDFAGITGTEDLEAYMRYYGLAGLSTAQAENLGECARVYIETEIIDKIYEAIQICCKGTKEHISQICWLSRDELADRVFRFLEQVSTGNKANTEDRIEGQIFNCLAEMNVITSVSQAYSSSEERIVLLIPWLAAAFPGCEWYGTKDWKECTLMDIILNENTKHYFSWKDYRVNHSEWRDYRIECRNKQAGKAPYMLTYNRPYFDADSWVYEEELTPYRLFTVLYSDERDPAPDCIITDKSMEEKLNRHYSYRLKRYILYLGKTCTDTSGLRWLNIGEYLMNPIDPATM